MDADVGWGPLRASSSLFVAVLAWQPRHTTDPAAVALIPNRLGKGVGGAEEVWRPLRSPWSSLKVFMNEEQLYVYQ